MTAPLIVLVGPMGVGKSTVGALLAERLRCAYRDTDDVIVASEGRSVADIFVEEGEARFRALEKDAVATALAEHHGVPALGGGAVLDAGTRRLLAAHTAVVHLSMGVEVAVGRAGLAAARPLLAGDPLERWQELAKARAPLYAEVARVVVATDGRAPEEVADAVLDALEPRR
ncbi:shikimate kinase [Streptomyces sp. NPDC056373]|uniref:shikimate kinase n=1 Tax=Streptomyces sp. NPDC056373 TaxID=3345798 RepID=UPI0035D6DC8D